MAAFDLTFSAPKSASVLFALGGDDVARRIVGVHTEAVAGAMAYLERHGVSAVRARPGPEQSVVATSGVAAACSPTGSTATSTRTCTATSSMANLVHGADGRWGACDSGGCGRTVRRAGAVYEAHLRGGLTAEFGVRWEGPPGRAEIEGMAPQLLGEFSSRAADVRRHAFERGARSALGRHVAWAATRPDKVEGTPFAALAGVGAAGRGGGCGASTWRARAVRPGGGPGGRRAPLRRGDLADAARGRAPA